MANKKSPQEDEEKGANNAAGTRSAANSDTEILRIIHQLNQPLTAINNYAQAGSQLIQSGMSDAQRMKDLFEKIISQCSRTYSISQELSNTIRNRV